MLAITSTDTADLENAYDAWRFAADEATDALHAWISGPGSARAAAFYAYWAALDREDGAALTDVVRTSGRPVVLVVHRFDGQFRADVPEPQAARTAGTQPPRTRSKS